MSSVTNVTNVAARPTRLLAISDVHGQVERFPLDGLPDPSKIDAVLLAGDITEGGLRDRRGLALASDWMQQLRERDKRVVYVPGNHDFGIDNQTWQGIGRSAGPGFCTGVHRSVCEALPDLWVVGCSLSTCFDAPGLAQIWCNMTARKGEDLLVWESMDRLVHGAIVLSHSPPLGIRDEATGGRNIGSPGLRDYIRRRQILGVQGGLRLVVCGHVHEAAGVAAVGCTLVLNVARCAVVVTLHPDGPVEWSVDRKAVWGGSARGIWTPGEPGLEKVS